ncbi:MAG: hypothetical protein PHQ28_12295 [Mycobacterium sp.]|nr:hypothetical protein [Mycobacterium sp.]
MSATTSRTASFTLSTTVISAANGISRWRRRRQEAVACFAALHAAVSGLVELSFEALSTPQRLRLLARLEEETRRLPGAAP